MSYWTLSTRDRDSLLVVSINPCRYNSPRPPCPRPPCPKLLPQNTPESFFSRWVTTLCRPNAHDTLARNRRLKLIPENRYTGFWRVCRAIWYRIIPVPVSGKELYVSCWRSFHVAAPAVWNALPSQLRSSSVSTVVDSLELGWKPISSHRPVDTSENLRWRAYYFTFTWYGFSAPTSSMCVIDVVNCWLSGATCCRQFVSICFRASVSLCNYSIFFNIIVNGRCAVWGRDDEVEGNVHYNACRIPSPFARRIYSLFYACDH